MRSRSLRLLCCIVRAGVALALLVGCGRPNNGTTPSTLGASAGTAMAPGPAAASGGNPVSAASAGIGAGASAPSSAVGSSTAGRGVGGPAVGAAGRGGVFGAGAGGQADTRAGAGASGRAAVSGGAAAAAGSAGTVPGAGGDVVVTIKNGGYWLDTAGNRIEAHGAGLIYTQDAWYWIGEDKSASSGSFKAVNCYRSTDLSHWEFRHPIITRQTSSDLAAADRIIERPKVVYNDTTHKYVMWLHWEGMNYGTAEAGVFTSDGVDGDYMQVRHFRPNNNMSRDDTLFKDDDGKAYFLSAANNNADSALYELNADYTNITRQITTLWAGSYREAPAIMKADGTYFIINSGATNWDPNQQKYATASAMNGPWSSLANLGNAQGFDTQSAFIITVKGSKTTTYIYAGDRWQDPDLKSSKYIWLPIKLNGKKLTLDNYDSWQLNVTTGEWSAAGM